MKSINLPAGTAHVPFGDLAQKIADAMWPGDDHFKRECARSDIADELARAVDAGMFHGLGGKPLPVKNPLTLGPHTFPVGAALQTALVAVNDVRAYVADLGIEVTVEKTVSQPHERVRVHDSDIEAGLRKLPPREAARWENAECDSDTRRFIMCRYAGSQGWRLATLEQFCEEVEGRLNRWRNGRYLVNEAAQVLADANPDTNVKSGIDAEVFCKQMEQAIHANKLTVRLNGIPVAADSLTQYRLHLYTVLQSDVNEWLKNSGAGYALDYPYQTTDADSQAAPVLAAVASDGVAQGLLTKEIAVTFDGVNGWNVQRWRRNLSASKWLHPARIALGAAGGASSVWNPLTLAQLMHSKTEGDQAGGLVMTAFNSRFTLNPVLMPWRDAFNEYFATHCTTD